MLMNLFQKPPLSSLRAFSTILCMVAMVFGGMATVQSSLRNLEHQISGDLKLPDGGWLSACDGTDECQGHVEPMPVEVGNDPIGLHHHHHFSDSGSGILSTSHIAEQSSRVARIQLRPGEDHNLAGRFSPSIDQPPRI